jgi:ABC-type multidrug transport system fused ATPase/permease subunit
MTKKKLGAFELLRHYRPLKFSYNYAALGILICGFLLASLELILPIFTKLLFDFVYKGKQHHAILTVLFGFSILLILHFISRTLFDFLLVYFNQRIGLELRMKILNQMDRVQVRYFQSQSVGDSVVRMTDDIDRATDVLLAQRLEALVAFYQVIGVSAICLWINPRAAWILVASNSFYLISARYLFKNELGVVRDRLTLQKSILIESLQAVFQRVRMVRLFHAEKRERESLEGVIRVQYALGIQDRVLRSIFSLNSVLGFDLWNVFIVWYLGQGILEGTLTVGDLLALLLLFSQIRQPLLTLGQQFGRFRTGMASLRRIHEVFCWPDEPSNDLIQEINPSSVKDRSQNSRGEVRVRGLSFGYSNSKLIFKDFDIEIPQKTYVTLAGDHGAGKSTLAQLLVGNEKPLFGSILIDGLDIEFLRRQRFKNGAPGAIIVDRDQGIFSGTLRENLTYGKPDASDSEIQMAIRDAALENWVKSLPQGMDTRLGGFQSSVAISRGERYRLSLARALLIRPSVLILDEVTSDLDLITDYWIQKTLRSLSHTCTVINIAQNASALKQADRIIFLKEGQVKDEGSFLDLMGKRGDFFQYYSLVHGGLPEFKRLLDYEIDRSLRHKSRFALATFFLKNYSNLAGSLSLPMRSELN